MAGLEASHSIKFASACEFHLDEYLDEVAKEDDDRRELCDGEERNDEIRHEKCLVFLVATNMLIKLAVGKDGDEGVPTRHAELGIHLPLADKRHNRDAEQHDQRNERRTEQGRVNIHYLNLPIVHTVHDPHAQLLHYANSISYRATSLRYT